MRKAIGGFISSILAIPDTLIRLLGDEYLIGVVLDTLKNCSISAFVAWAGIYLMANPSPSYERMHDVVGMSILCSGIGLLFLSSVFGAEKIRKLSIPKYAKVLIMAWICCLAFAAFMLIIKEKLGGT